MPALSGEIEADETYIGGKRKNMSIAKRKALAGTGAGTVGKAAALDTEIIRIADKRRVPLPCSQGLMRPDLQLVLRKAVPTRSETYRGALTKFQ